MVQITTASL